MTFPLQDLRCHGLFVEDRTGHEPVIFEEARHAKPRESDTFLVTGACEREAARLDVAVYDLLFVHVTDSLDDGAAQGPRFFLAVALLRLSDRGKGGWHGI